VINQLVKVVECPLDLQGRSITAIIVAFCSAEHVVARSSSMHLWHLIKASFVESVIHVLTVCRILHIQVEVPGSCCPNRRPYLTKKKKGVEQPRLGIVYS
jgi:hypothetical protein